MGFNVKWYGWLPDLPDKRDFKYSFGISRRTPNAPAPTPSGSLLLPDGVDLRTSGLLPPVFDQGELGSCTANALSAMFSYTDAQQTGDDFIPSRLFIYYNERVAEGTVNSDCGAHLRTGIKTLVNDGACNEQLYPYLIEQFTAKPSDLCYAVARHHQAMVYRSVAQKPEDMKACLTEGYPFCAGISVYESFESDEVAKTGLVPMPARSESLQGGHAILIVGYTPTSYIAMNSWGADWGQAGFFELPQDYLHDPDLACDFWMIHTVED